MWEVFKIKSVMKKTSNAIAYVKGGKNNPDLHGIVTFRQTEKGVLVTAKIFGLPQGINGYPGIFAFHIHEGTSCAGIDGEEFVFTGGHYNPSGLPHPYHAGDLPPLFENKGYAYMSVLTDRFTVRDILGRVVIIHSSYDDFTTQPSGNSGNKIACGKIIMQ